MREGNTYRRRMRSLIAVCLGALFCLASLTPLAAAASTSIAHCGSKTKCCCRKAHSTAGPAISSRSCASDCGRITLGSTGNPIYAPPSFADSSPAIVVAYTLLSQDRATHALRVNDSHRQRPPPFLSL
jgi:hypothetical protein